MPRYDMDMAGMWILHVESYQTQYDGYIAYFEVSAQHTAGHDQRIYAPEKKKGCKFMTWEQGFFWVQSSGCAFLP